MKKKYLLSSFTFLVIPLIVVLLYLGNNIFAASNELVISKVKILVCGDEVREGWEECDRQDLGGASCSALGYGAGTLSCDPACEFDTSACSPAPACGDSSCNGLENCSNCPMDCGNCQSIGGGGGGGGGGASIVPAATIIFSGRAYPNSTVTLLKDAQVAATTVADAQANFYLTLSGINAGDYIFSLYSEDYKGIRSSLLSFPAKIISGVSINTDNIFIAPTIGVDKSEVKQGDEVLIFGQSVANSEITIAVHSNQEFLQNVITDINGVYLHRFNTEALEIGEHFTKAKAAFSNQISSFSKAVNFVVGANNVVQESKCEKADLNCNGRVNLVDFSIAAFWYKKASPPEEIDLNKDGKIDLIDFSIMAYYWTG